MRQKNRLRIQLTTNISLEDEIFNLLPIFIGDSFALKRKGKEGKKVVFAEGQLVYISLERGERESETRLLRHPFGLRVCIYKDTRMSHLLSLY